MFIICIININWKKRRVMDDTLQNNKFPFIVRANIFNFKIYFFSKCNQNPKSITLSLREENFLTAKMGSPLIFIDSLGMSFLQEDDSLVGGVSI